MRDALPDASCAHAHMGLLPRCICLCTCSCLLANCVARTRQCAKKPACMQPGRSQHAVNSACRQPVVVQCCTRTCMHVCRHATAKSSLRRTWSPTTSAPDFMTACTTAPKSTSAPPTHMLNVITLSCRGPSDACTLPVLLCGKSCKLLYGPALIIHDFAVLMYGLAVQ
jgi:hypothetical protein